MNTITHDSAVAFVLCHFFWCPQYVPNHGRIKTLRLLGIRYSAYFQICSKIIICGYMRIYRIYGVYSSNHFVRISYAAYVKLLSCEGLPSAKNCMGILPLDSPKLNKDGSITLWNRCMMQKKNILESSRNGFIVEITRNIFPPI